MIYVAGKGRVHIEQPLRPAWMLCGRRRIQDAEVISALIAGNLRLCAQCEKKLASSSSDSQAQVATVN